MHINVNGRSFTFANSQIGYEEVVRLAEMTGTPSVTYVSKRRDDSRRSGAMHTGCTSVELEDGMVFNVVHTGNA